MARGGGISLGMLASAGIGILVVSVVFMLAPVIPEKVQIKRKFRKEGFSGARGGQMEAAMPALGATSNWNATYRARFLKRSPPESKQHRTEDTLRVKTIHEGSQSFKGPDVWEQLGKPG